MHHLIASRITSPCQHPDNSSSHHAFMGPCIWGGNGWRLASKQLYQQGSYHIAGSQWAKTTLWRPIASRQLNLWPIGTQDRKSGYLHMASRIHQNLSGRCSWMNYSSWTIAYSKSLFQSQCYMHHNLNGRSRWNHLTKPSNMLLNPCNRSPLYPFID
jgi:hypothetical protein